MTNIETLYKLRVFSLENVSLKVGLTKASASKALLRWQQQGLVRMIRRNMYTVVDLTSDKSVVDKYEVASRINNTSYVGWHTALEYHGIAHQPFYNTYVGTKSRFNPFSFEDIDFECCIAPIEPSGDSGIISQWLNPNVKVTDLERTIIDCCDRIDRAGGAEELMHCLESVVMVDEEKITHYLSLFGKAFLYQKVGFVLERIKNQANISIDIIEHCRKKGALHVKRLTNDAESDLFIKEWNLYIPKYLKNIENQALI